MADKAQIEKQIAQFQRQLDYNTNLLKTLPKKNDDLQDAIDELKKQLKEAK